MLDRLDALEDEFRSVEARLSDPAVFEDNAAYVALTRRHKELEPVVAAVRERRQAVDDLATAKEMLEGSSGEDREMLRAEITAAESTIERLDDELKVLLLPKDPNDGRTVIVEIRGAEGGEEANLFARDLYEMYVAYAGRQGWKLEVMDSSVSDMGGFDSVTFSLKGDTAWSHMKHEGGPHRVQRVPVTESQGRIHTSSATVTVLPEAEEVWMRPWLSVTGTRCTRCGPPSFFMCDQAVSPFSVKITWSKPPRSLSDDSITSSFQPCRLAYPAYMS